MTGRQCSPFFPGGELLPALPPGRQMRAFSSRLTAIAGGVEFL
jgi:hypothetical protein